MIHTTMNTLTTILSSTMTRMAVATMPMASLLDYVRQPVSIASVTLNGKSVSSSSCDKPNVPKNKLVGIVCEKPPELRKIERDR